MFWKKRPPTKLNMSQFTPIPEGGYLVGGAVRDVLLGRTFADVDWLVEQPEKVAKQTALELNGSAFPLDDERGVWRVMTDGMVRDYIRLETDLETNLRERDFTLNAIALDSEGNILDPLGGQQDIRSKTIRMVSANNLWSDPLRALRAVRFATQLTFKIEPETEKTIRELVKQQQAKQVALSAWERIKEELEKIIVTPRAGFGFQQLDDLGMLTLYLPELTEGRGVSQGGLHHLDVLNHSLEALQQLVDHFPDADVSVRWATLLHDVGKPRTKQEQDGLSFHGHAELGADMAKEMLSRLRYSTEVIEQVHELVHYHMLPLPHKRSDVGDSNKQFDPDEQLDKEIRRFIHRRRALLPDLLKLMLADREAARGRRASEASRLAYRLAIARILKVLEEAPPKPPLLTGQDVMRLLSLSPGPRVGEALAFVREAEAVGDVSTREEAEESLRNYARVQGWGSP